MRADGLEKLTGDFFDYMNKTNNSILSDPYWDV